MKSYETICKESYLEKEFLKYLNDDEIKIISFDIFDTLVFRKESLPVEIFRKIGKNSFVKNIFISSENFVNQRIAAEKEARKDNSKKEEVRLKDIYTKLPLSKEEQKKALKIELEVERKSLYINEHVLNWIELIKKKNKEIIFISDIYFTKKELYSLVFNKLRIEIKPQNIFVSSELYASKATGNAYQKILNKLNVKPSTILHIGDNYYSDIQMASKNGFKSLYYSSDEYIKELASVESHTNKSFKYAKIKEQSSTLNPYEEEKARFFFNLGAYTFAPILWEFSYFLKDIIEKNKISQINFIMREGKLFNKCFKMIDTKTNTNLLYASRKSTFLASLNLDAIKKGDFNFYKHRGLKVEDVYLLFELEITDKYINEHKLEEIKNLSSHKKLEKSITIDFQKRSDEIVVNINQQRQYFKEYLNQIKYKKNSMMVDFGGTGSILKNINEIMNNKKSYNVLFYTHEQGVTNMLGSKVFSFLQSNNKDKQAIELIRRTHQLIEVLFNGNESTTLGYKKEDKIVVLRDSLNKVMKENKNSLTAFEKGIETFFTVAKKYKVKSKTFKKEDMLNAIKRVIDTPSLIEAKELGNLYYDKSIGKDFERIIENNAIDFIKKEGKAEFFYNYQKSLSFGIENIVWPQAELTLYDKEYIKNAKGLITKNINSQSIEKIVEKLDFMPHIKEVYIYGAGIFFQELIPLLEKKQIKIKALFDTRAKIKPFIFEGYNVKYLDDKNIKKEDVIIIASAVFAKEIRSEIKSSVDVNIVDCL